MGTHADTVPDMTTLTIDQQSLARQIAKAGPLSPEQLDALFVNGLRRQGPGSPRDLAKLSLFFVALHQQGYRAVSFNSVDGYDVTKLVEYLPVPSELSAALARRGCASGRPRSEGGFDNFANVCWMVAQWAQRATAAEVACLAALLANCLPIPVAQLLETATLVAA